MGPFRFHRSLDCRTRTYSSVTPEDLRIFCEIRHHEEVRVRNREILPHKVFVVGEMPIKVRLTSFQTAMEHFFGLFCALVDMGPMAPLCISLEKKLSHACSLVRSIVPSAIH
jgi:hypothetical protein